MLRLCATLLAFFLLGCAAHADEPAALRIGDPAPAYTVGPVLIGDAVSQLPHDRPCVVAVFATWSIRAREQLPCLAKLSRAGAALVVGVCAREVPGETAPLRAFVETMGDQIPFSVHSPADAGVFERAWLDAAKCDRLPVAFVLDKTGRIAAIQEWGNPKDCLRLETIVEKVAAGTWDIDLARADRALANDPARQIAEFEEWRTAIDSGDPDRIFAASDALLEKSKGCERLIAEVVRTLGVREDTAAKTYRWADTAMHAHAWHHAVTLNSVAWFMADDANAKAPDLEVAQLAAERAVELTRNHDGSVLDTLALVCFKRGDVKRALELQRSAVEFFDVRGDPEPQRRLKLYEEAAK